MIGRRIEVGCSIQGTHTSCLWDTGSQLSLVSKDWLKSNLQNYTIQPVMDMISHPLTIEGVGNRPVPYAGVAALELKLGLGGSEEPVMVPFLVCEVEIRKPIIGTNVIDFLIGGDKTLEGKLRKISTFGLDDSEADAMTAQVRQDHDMSVLTVVAAPCEREIVIPADASRMAVTCEVDPIYAENKTTVLFEPRPDWYLICPQTKLHHSVIDLEGGRRTQVEIYITNSSGSEVRVERSCVFGTLEVVESTYEFDVDYHEFNSEAEQVASVNLTTASTPTTREAAMETALPEKEFALLTVEEIPEEDKQFFQKVGAIELPELTSEEAVQMRAMLWQERGVFSRFPDDIGNVPDLVLDIETTDQVPVQKRYNAIPRTLYAEVKNHVQNMLDRGWITKSKSSWSSPVVITKKKNGEIRFCVDYRMVNKKTIRDCHPIPRITEALDTLVNSKYFSVVDLSRAYYQGFTSATSRDKTAFVTPWGFYEFVRIPFGLTNAVATFQRYMEETLEEERNHYALPYLDDTIIHSETVSSHIEHVRNVLRRFRSKGLKLNLDKCSFCKLEASYLGRIVSASGYRMDERSTQAVRDLAGRTYGTVGEVRQLLGLLSFHRRHVQNFAATAKCLSDLLVGDGASPTHKNARKDDRVPSSKKIRWEGVHGDALTKLIEAITNPPILAYADFESEFFIHTDASGHGLGAILYQKQKGVTRVIAYASRTLKPAEVNYTSAKLEFTAMRWAITDQFKDYLAYADHFAVFTDNNPLLYVMDQQKPANTSTQRWVNELAEYNFSIHYRPGKINKDADCLSRLPLDIDTFRELCRETATLDTFQAMVASIAVDDASEDAEAVSSDDEDDDYEEECLTETMEADQMEDEYIGPVRRIIAGTGERPAELSKMSKVLLRSKNKLYLDHRGLLCRRSGALHQLVLPLKHRDMVYDALHTKMGHLGSERTFQLARQRVYWPGMEGDIEEFTRKRCRCLTQRKSRQQPVAPLVSIHSAAPMELVAIDFLHLEKATGGQEYILLIVDHFTRFAQAYPTRNKKAFTAAKILFGDYITRFGIPARILHDQGGEFENKLFHSMEQHYGISRARTTPYHPQCNGCCERMNATLLQMLRTLQENQKQRWPEELSKLMFAYNSTRHSATGHSPYFLLYGREPLLPLDVVLGRVPKVSPKASSYRSYTEEWGERMARAYQIASENSRKSKGFSEERWKKRLLASELQIGDRVLVKNKEQGGPGKLRAQYEPDIYAVQGKLGEEGVVYRVSKLRGKKQPERTLHRNMLLPCNLLDDLQDAPDRTVTDHRGSRNRGSRPPAARIRAVPPVEETQADSDSDPETVLDAIEATAPSVHTDEVRGAAGGGATGSPALMLGELDVELVSDQEDDSTEIDVPDGHVSDGVGTPMPEVERRVLRSRGRRLAWNPSMGDTDLLLEKPPKRGVINWIRSRFRK